MSDYKLVPVEPTDEMVSEGARHLRIMSLPAREAASVFRAMLAAAPVTNIVATKNEQGQIVSVTLQDEDHRILEVIAEAHVQGELVGYIRRSALELMKNDELGVRANIIKEPRYQDCVALYTALQTAEQQPALTKYQPCGCVICTCEHETQCQGCGAKHCGTHPVGQFSRPVYQQPAPDVARLVEALEAVVFYDEEVEDNDGNLMMHYSNMLRKVRAALAAYRKEASHDK